MAGGVRELVEEHEGELAAVDHELGLVLGEPAARQKTHSSPSSACWTYSSRHGAQSCLIGGRLRLPGQSQPDEDE